jgi:hypothetical protein
MGRNVRAVTIASHVGCPRSVRDGLIHATRPTLRASCQCGHMTSLLVQGARRGTPDPSAATTAIADEEAISPVEGTKRTNRYDAVLGRTTARGDDTPAAIASRGRGRRASTTARRTVTADGIERCIGTTTVAAGAPAPCTRAHDPGAEARATRTGPRRLRSRIGIVFCCNARSCALSAHRDSGLRSSGAGLRWYGRVAKP